MRPTFALPQSAGLATTLALMVAILAACSMDFDEAFRGDGATQADGGHVGGSGGSQDGGKSGAGGSAGSGGVGGTGGVASGSGGSAGGVGGTGGTAGASGSSGSGGMCAVGHDEDADGIDDGCDSCPTRATSEGNADGDGVGDGCELTDPSVLSTIRYFESFMAVSPGTWTLDNGFELGSSDALIGDCSGCEANAVWNHVLSGTRVVEASFVLNGSSSGQAGVVSVWGQPASTWWGCFLKLDPHNHALELWELNPSTSDVNLVSSIANVEPQNTSSSTQRWVRAVRSGASRWCEFFNASGDAAQSSPVADSSAEPTDGPPGLRFYDAIVQYRSFIVYQ